MFAASKSGRAGSAAPTTDASFGYVPLLLETGSSSSLNTTVTDSSASPNTVTRVSNPSTGWVSPYQTDGYWGNQFNGTNAYLTSTIPALSGQFTIDFWLYRPASGNNYFFTIGDALNSTGLEVYLGTAGTVFNVWSGGVQITSSTLPTVGSWNYIALTRDASNVVRMYLNGSQVGSTWTSSSTFSTTLRIGVELYNSIFTFAGGCYISNFRISNNVRTVTSVPTAPFSNDANTLFLSCQSNRFKDNSSNNATVTLTGTPQVDPYFYPSGFTAPTASPGAALFSGTSQYLKSTTATTAFQFGTNPFTIEFWLYQPARPTRQYFCGGVFSGAGFQVVMEPTGFIFSGVTGVGDLPAATIAVPLNAWTHIAVVRTSTSASGAAYYINGVSAGTFTISSNISGTASSINVGTSGDSGSEPTNGYIANFRSVKGTAVYTGAFTPPSGPLTQNGGTYPSLTNVVTGFTAANTSLLLNLADSNYLSATNGVQNNTFIDESNYAFPITRNGTPTQGSITPYWPNGQWSNNLPTTSDYLTIAANAVFTLGTANHTVEFWAYQTAYQQYATPWSYASTTANQNTDSYYITNGSLSSALLVGAGGSWGVNFSFTLQTLNTWHHYAITRSGSNWALFIDGTRVGTATYAGSIGAQTQPMAIGRGNFSPNDTFQGYISNLRISKGVAVYDPAQTTITVPTAPLTATTGGATPPSGTQCVLLTCQSNRFLDRSAQVTPATITPNGTPRVQAFQPFSPTASYTTALYGGSGYFNGSTDYLSETDLTPITFGTGDFTIEFWHYLISKATAYPIVFYISGNSSGTSNVRIEFDATHNISGPTSYNIYAPGIIINAGTVAYNTWSHIALVRSSNTLTLYLNGASIGSASVTGVSFGGTGTGLRVMGDGGATTYAYGYLSNFRIVKGTAVYTGAFTPPTLAPLALTGPASAASYSSTTNVNTTFLTPASLLLNMTNAGIYDAAAQNDITTVADAKTDTTIKQWPLSSVKFDGTGDFLRMVDAPVFDLGSSDFTIEAWIYTASSAQVIYARESPVLDGILFQVASGLTLGVNLSSNGTNYTSSGLILTGGSITANTWTYAAVTRVGSGTNNIKLFLGTTPGGSATQVAQGTFSGSIYNASTLTPIIGARNTNAELPFNGYIQDFRITRGVGRTISTVPSASFPTR